MAAVTKAAGEAAATEAAAAKAAKAAGERRAREAAAKAFAAAGARVTNDGVVTAVGGLRLHVAMLGIHSRSQLVGCSQTQVRD